MPKARLSAWAQPSASRKAGPKPKPDGGHGDGAGADCPDRFIKGEVGGSIRSGLEQLLGEFERGQVFFTVEDTLNLIGGRVPQFPTKGPGHLVPDGGYLIVTGHSPTPEGGIAIVDQIAVFEELGLFEQLTPGGWRLETGFLKEVFAIDQHLGIPFDSHAIVGLRLRGILAIGAESGWNIVINLDVGGHKVGQVHHVSADNGFSDPLAVHNDQISSTLGRKIGEGGVVPLRNWHTVDGDIRPFILAAQLSQAPHTGCQANPQRR